MPYTPTTYVDGTTPALSAANLNHAETAIASNDGRITTLEGAVPAKQPLLTPTAVKTANYTAAAGDLVVCDPSGGSFTVTLPSAPADKTQVAVKIVVAPGVNTVAVTCGGTDKFNSASGGTSGTLALLGHSMFMQYQASTGLWFTIADDIPLTQIDARYPKTDMTAAAVGQVVAVKHVTGGSADGFELTTDAGLPPALTLAGPPPYMAVQANAATNSWTNTATSGTVTLADTADAPYGAQAIKLVTAGTNSSGCHTTAAGLALDMTDRDPVLWVKVDDITTLRALEIRMGDAGFANFFYLEVEASATASQNNRFLRSGVWHRVSMPWGAISSITGAPNRGQLAQVRVTVLDYGTGAATVHIAGFGHQPQPIEYPNGVCCFTFDDGFATQYTVARPILDKYGYPATALPIVDLVGSSGTYMTLAQLRDLQDRFGWAVGAHAATAAAHNAAGALTSLSASALDDELRLNKKWLRLNGFRALDLHAYPQGLYNQSVLDATRGYYACSRSQHTYRRDTLPVADPYRIRTFNLGNTDTLASAQAAVDEAAANRELLLFTAHQLISPATTGSQWTPADFATLVDYVAAKGMAVRTLPDALTRSDQGTPAAKATPNPGAGAYFYPVSATATTTSSTMGNGNLRAFPWRVLRTISLARLAAEITVVGDAGSKLRLGIYADNGAGYPGALVVDAGQIAADAVAVAELTIAATLPPGLYWMGAVVQAVTTTQPTVRTVGTNYDMPVPIAVSTTLPAGGGSLAGFATGASAVTGALPATFPAGGFLSGTAARLIARTA